MHPCPSADIQPLRLLDANADPNAASHVGETPLHVAAARCDAEVVSELVRSGASITDRNTLGQVPLHQAVWAGNDRAAAVLLAQKEQEVDVKDNDDSTPLHYACQFFPIGRVAMGVPRGNP